MKAIRLVATVLAVGIGASVATAQPGKTLREQIVGTWDFIIAEIVTQDGKKSFPFGERPKGMLIFTDRRPVLAGACVGRSAAHRVEKPSRRHA